MAFLHRTNSTGLTFSLYIFLGACNDAAGPTAARGHASAPVPAAHINRAVLVKLCRASRVYVVAQAERTWLNWASLAPVHLHGVL